MISVIDSPRLVCVPLSAYLVQTRSVGGMAFIKAIQEADPTLPMARRRADCDGPGPVPKTDQSAPVEKPNTLEVEKKARRTCCTRFAISWVHRYCLFLWLYHIVN
jgi:hypothetical protein